MQIRISKEELALSDILEIFEELSCFMRSYIETINDDEKKEVVTNNINKIQDSVADKLIERINIPKGSHLAFKTLDNHTFTKEIILLFFKGILTKPELEYFIKYIANEEELLLK